MPKPEKRYFNLNSTKQPTKGTVHTAFEDRVTNVVGTSIEAIVTQYLIDHPPAGGSSIGYFPQGW
jgi:hypothetical protein